MSGSEAAFFVGSDHGGVALLDLLCAHLEATGARVVARTGPRDPATRTDYPDVAAAVARQVVAHPGHLGLLVCGTGQGMAIAANKVLGARAGVVLDPFSARMLRAHNDANLICLGERVVGVELAKLLLDEFRAASFEGGRHRDRVDKIEPGAQG